MQAFLAKRSKAGCGGLLAALVALGGLTVSGCGGVGSTGGGTTTGTGAVTPSVTVTASPAGGVSTAQSLSVTVAVTASAGTPAGSVVLSSGSYASFPVSLSGGMATVSVPAGLLTAGTDTLTAQFTSSNSSAFTNASGTSSVTVAASGAVAPMVTATSVTYSTGGYGSPFRALPLANGQVLVSVTAATSGLEVFGPAAGGGLKLSCFNSLRPAFVQDGASDLGLNLTPNGLGLAATLGVDGAIFYNLSTLETCNSTGVQVSQGSVASDQGSFDVVVTPDGKYAFVANEYGVAAGATTQGNVGVIALQYDATGVVSGGTLMGQISTGGQAIAGVTLSPDGSRLYVTSEIASSPSTIAGASNPVLTKNTCVQQAGGRRRPMVC